MPEKTPTQHRYWFPAKRYGWGWGAPTRWQGKAVLFLWILAVAAGLLIFGRHHPLAYLGFVLAMLGLLMLICYATGEPPAWRPRDRE
jgi:hypothetical protein